jgi:hypothetical protein
VPNNFHATSVAEVQNIHYLTQEIAQNFQVEINTFDNLAEITHIWQKNRLTP